MEIINCAITSPRGFMASSAMCGLKKNNKRDLALIACNSSAVCAGVYTGNIVKGHSLQRSIEIINKYKSCRAMVINTGNANACVGPIGAADAEEMAKQLAFHMNVHPDEVLTASTGVIGQALPMDKIRLGIANAFNSMDFTPEAGHQAASAILTTDLRSKEAGAAYDSNGEQVTIAGMAKGSGMIHPNLATMIGVITTDAHIEYDILQAMLRDAANKSFNRTTVDGDTSVCDMVVVLASAQAGEEITDADSPDANQFKQALDSVCMSLARQIAADGEGANKLVDIRVEGAASAADAYYAARAVAVSPLCKTAFFGEDANWGRIITALGYSGAMFNPDFVDIYIGNLAVCRKGLALPFDENEALAIMKQKEFYVLIQLNAGPYSDHYWTCDFSYDYVKINASYRS